MMQTARQWLHSILYPWLARFQPGHATPASNLHFPFQRWNVGYAIHNNHRRCEPYPLMVIDPAHWGLVPFKLRELFVAYMGNLAAGNEPLSSKSAYF